MEIIFENENLAVINKPAGVVVNRSQTQDEETVQDWWRNELGETAFAPQQVEKLRPIWQKLIPTGFSDDFGTPEEIWQERQGLVHRLDKETSGALLLAKNPGSLVNLLAQFKQRRTQKTYLALCHGHFELKSGKINAPLGRAMRNRFRYAISPTGKPAETLYEVKEEFNDFKWEELKAQLKDSKTETEYKALKKILKRGPQLYAAGFSLVEAQPKTGRTHQLRVHLASLHHPLVGDKVYSGHKRQALDSLWCERHFLHASKLEFYLPDGPEWQTRQTVEADIDATLSKAINML